MDVALELENGKKYCEVLDRRKQDCLKSTVVEIGTLKLLPIGSEGNEEYAVGSWRKRGPCYVVGESSAVGDIPQL